MPLEEGGGDSRERGRSLSEPYVESEGKGVVCDSTYSHPVVEGDEFDTEE